MGVFARHQDLMGCSESRFTRCADRDMPFGEQQTHAYLRCVLPLALPGDTDGPWCVPIKGKYAWHCKTISVQGWVFRRTKRIVAKLTGQEVIVPLLTSRTLIDFFVRWRCFNWALMGWGKLWVSLAQPTNRGLLGRETHKLGGVVVLIETSWYNMMCIHLR